MNAGTAMNTLQVTSTSFQVSVANNFQVTVGGNILSFNGTDLLINALPIGGGGFDYLTEFSYNWDPATTILKFSTGAMQNPSPIPELEISKNGFTAVNQAGMYMFNYWDVPNQTTTNLMMLMSAGAYIYNSSATFSVYNSSNYQTSFQVSTTNFQVRVNGGTFSFDGMGLSVNGMPVGGGGGGGGGGFTYLTEGPNQWNGAITELKFNTGVYGTSKEFILSKQEFSVLNDMGQFALNRWNSQMGYGEQVAYISGYGAMLYTGTLSVNTITYQELMYISDTDAKIQNSNRKLVVRNIPGPGNSYNPPFSMDLNGTMVSFQNMMGMLFVNGEMGGYNTLNIDQFMGASIMNNPGEFLVRNQYYTNTFQVTASGAYSYGWNTYSDSTLKENIIPIPSSLNKVMSLEGVKFDWKRDMSADYGFIAQQVKEILPEVVKETNGLLTVNYTSIIAVQNEAIKELNKKIDKYDGIIDGLTKEIDKLRPA
jgi:hypothetical protein